MKTVKFTLSMIVLLAFSGMNEAECQWAANGANINNTNTGNVGIGNNTPATLLHVGKNMTEPTITVQNLGGNGGATYTMMDNTSGANWKFKATNTGGFKIRDHANLMDVITIEPNSFANAIFIKTTDNMGIGTASPHGSALLDLTSTSKGLLPPRMTLAQLTAITTPADGLLVFCTDCGTGGSGAITIFIAGTWLQLSASSCLTSPPAPAEGAHTPSSAQIIWEWDAVTGATGYRWSATNDFATAEEMGTLTSKTETGLSSSTNFTRFAWAYNACGNTAPTTLTATTSAWVCGGAFAVDHIAGTVAPVSKAVTYGTVTNIPGETSKCWITSNLGADHQATSVFDNTEASAGWYWQFNKYQGFKHDGTTRTPNTTWITSISQNSEWLISNDPCALLLGTGWRLPTHNEWTNVDVAGSWTDWNGPWNSALKLHAAGYLLTENATLVSNGGAGICWSSSQIDNGTAKNIYFYSTGCVQNTVDKAYANSVRCMKD